MRDMLGVAGRLALGATLAGAAVGLAEAVYRDAPRSYAMLLNGTAWALGMGLTALLVAALPGPRRALGNAAASTGFAVALGLSAAVLGRFIIWRDVFHEAPGKGLAATGLGLAAALGFGSLAAALGALVERRLAGRGLPGAFAWGGPLVVAGAFAFVATTTPDDTQPYTSAAAPTGHGSGVILIVADALRADALGAYGAPTHRDALVTPNLDTFAKEAVVFTRASAQASWTKPAMASVMTSRHVSGHNTMAKPAILPEALPTLASELQARDVTTAAVVTNYNLARAFGFAHGFDEFDYLAPARYLGAPPEANRLAAYNAYRLLRERYFRAGRESRYFYRPADSVNAQALDIVDRVGAGKFFLWLHYMEPHDPYFDTEGRSWAKVSDPHPAAADAEPMRRAYLDGVRRFDTAFGALMAALEARQMAQSTYVVVMADHGEEFAEHGAFYHGTSLYEEMLHIPLLVRGPGISPEVRDTLARQVDIAPTVLGWLNGQAPESWEGISLFGGKPADASLAEEDHEGNVLASVQTNVNGRLTKLVTANADSPRGLPPVSLFDLSVDPREVSPLPADDLRRPPLEATL
ncbi:MAG TPA: sulfatase, partial [Myxococcota bacterium]|nr:sulfatase [Myxococcota bacterium]